MNIAFAAEQPGMRRSREGRAWVRSSLRICFSMLTCSILIACGARAQDSPHGDIRFECNTCHTTDSWKMTAGKTFDHSSTGFALTGQHASVRCESCHPKLVFAKKSSACLSCHADVHKSELGAQCLRCHTTQSWKISDMVQRHQSSRFPLLGRHATLDCQSCHPNAGLKQYTGIPVDCYGCHRADYTGSQFPNHMAAGFPTNCVQCHQVTATSWGTGFQHDQTGFPLTGAHLATACFDCHQTRVFKGLATTCVSCHRPAFTTAKNPDHVAAQFSTDCQMCHTPTAWRPSTFSHTITRFPLTGAHLSVPCAQCHTNGQYTTLSTNCVDCHLADFNNSVNPKHVAGTFGTNCQQCHATTAWRPAQFDHGTTRFTLTGVHTTTQCAACHVNNNYTLAFTNCYACHTAQFAQPTNPNHVLGNLNHDCTPCHTTTVWKPSTFSHATTTFPLVGAHQAVACNQCHVNNQYQGLLQTCWDCHATDFNGTANPGHVAGQFNHDCTQCHTQNAWQPASFNHASTNFPLTGTHTTTACVSCHTNGNYNLKFTDCYVCHSADFARPTLPNHVAQIFPHDCTGCHGTSVWTPNTMNHDAAWFRIYSGNHRGRWTQCSQCHTALGNLASYSCTTGCHQTAHHQGEDCYSCHKRA
jgi:hypothetical protein